MGGHGFRPARRNAHHQIVGLADVEDFRITVGGPHIDEVAADGGLGSGVVGEPEAIDGARRTSQVDLGVH